LPPEAEGFWNRLRSTGLSYLDHEVLQLLQAIHCLWRRTLISVGRTNTGAIFDNRFCWIAVTTVLESDEEEPDVRQKLEELQISEEEGEAEVPVIVETYEGG